MVSVSKKSTKNTLHRGTMRFQRVITCAMAVFALWAPPSCKESPTTTPADAILALTPRPPGYYYPRVIGFLPDTGPAPVNTEAAVIFNIPIISPAADTDIRVSSGNLGRYLDAGAGEYTLTVNDPANITIVTITFSYGGVNPLDGGDTLTVSINNSIVDRDRGIPLTGTVTRTFSTGTEPDITAPTVVAASRNPINPVTVELTDADRIALGQDIHVNFSEQMDPSSINDSTFVLMDGAVLIPADVSYNSGTLRATLTPRVNLDPARTCTVTVRGGGIPYQSVRDLSGNYLAANSTWTFDTTATPLDITPGAPPFLTGLYVDSVSANSSSISWSTNEPADYRLHFGRGDDMTRLTSSAVDSSFQSAALALNTVADDPNARYWFYVDFQDIEGQPIVNSPTYQFNTLSTEAGTPVDSGAGNQHEVKTIVYNPLNGAAPTGAFLYWINDGNTAFNHIYIQRYSNTFTAQWNGGSPKPLFVEAGQSYTCAAEAEDGVGGTIVVAQRTSNSRAYAKHVDGAGVIQWGAAAGGTDAGAMVRGAAITSVSAVPVYNGFVQRVTTPAASTAEMGTWLNHTTDSLFDDSVNLSGVANGDIVVNRATNGGVTASRIVTDNFNYMAGLSTGIFAAGDTYYVGDGTANRILGFTVEDHTITATNAAPVPPPYISGGGTFYTAHANTFWTAGPPVWVDTGDIVRHVNNDTYGVITNPVELTPVSSIKTGLADGGGDDLYVWLEWWAGVSVNDYVVNDDNGDSQATVTAINVIPFTLTLNPAGMSFNSGDTYFIFDKYCSGHLAPTGRFYTSFYQIDVDWAIGITSATTASLYNYKSITGAADARPAATGPLYDNDSSFLSAVAPLPVAAGDVVVNYTDSTLATVTAASWNHALELDGNIMNGNDSYDILRLRFHNTDATDIVTVGTANFDQANHLRSANTFAAVTAGDIAYNLTDDTYAMVTARAAGDLTLSWDAFDTGNERFVIFRRRGVMYVWQEGTSIRGRVMTMETPLEQLWPNPAGDYFAIATGTGPRAVSDGYGRAIVAYVNGSEIRAARVNAVGAVSWNTLVDANVAAAKTILDVQSDGAGGAVILYKYGNDIHAQRMSGAGARQWGVNGRLFDNDGATTITSDEVMTYLTAADDVVVTATVNTATATNDIRTWRRGATPWLRAVTNLGTNQVRPKVFNNGTDLIIVWDDDRFFNQSYISTACGVFGLRIRLTDGSPAGAAINWRANVGSGTDDYNGASVILNLYNQYPGYPILVPYNNSTEAVLIWEDYRAGAGGDLLYLDNIQAFDPSL